jgi:hypothetical protein
MGSVQILLLLGLLLAVGLQCGRPSNLYPNGALVPEEMQEARQLHEAAMEAAEERINGPHPPTTTTRRPRSPSLVLPPAPPLVLRIAAGATGGARRPLSPVPRLPAPPSLVSSAAEALLPDRERRRPVEGDRPLLQPPVLPQPPKRAKFREVNVDICKLFVCMHVSYTFLINIPRKFAKKRIAQPTLDYFCIFIKCVVMNKVSSSFRTSFRNKLRKIHFPPK